MRSRTTRWLVTGALAASMLVLQAPAATPFTGFHPPAVGGNFGPGPGETMGWYGCDELPQAGFWSLGDGAGSFYFGGDPADLPVTGDWNRDDTDTVGVYRNGTWFLNFANDSSPPELVFSYGNPGDQPVAGDWNGNGRDTVGVFRDGQWFLRKANSTGPANWVFWFGNPGDIPIAGDWDGDGIDTIGVYRPSTGFTYLRNSNSTGPADAVLSFGPYNQPTAYDTDGDGDDDPAVSGRVC